MAVRLYKTGVNQIIRDIRFAWRQIRRNPGFAAIAVLAVALGIGPNTAILSVVYATLLAPMPYPNPDQLVIFWSKINGDRNGFSAGYYLDWKRQATVFQNLDAFTGNSFNLAAKDAPEQIQGQTETAGWWAAPCRARCTVPVLWTGVRLAQWR